MLSRLHSTNTLVEGMSSVASASSSRKRELEQKIQEPCIIGSLFGAGVELVPFTPYLLSSFFPA